MVAAQSLTERGAGTPVKVDAAAAQIIAYAVLAACSLLTPARDPGAAVSVPVTAAGVLLALAAFLVCSPLRDGLAGRVIAAVAAVASLAFALVPSIRSVIFPAVATGAEGVAEAGHPQEVWAAGACGLLVALVIVSFARQMAREERSHLIRSLSHGVTGGVACIAVSGWCFLPDLIEAGRSTGSAAVWAAVAVIVVVAAALAACSRLWAGDANPPEGARRPGIGIGLIPVMLLGPVVAISSLVVALL